ncbi:MAG TPA: citrate/2-methylcitrate synthase, partial [Tepidisphaeraceae bacterium]|nr:citrate/2-methylcitrate synthase [Tepidisphaeraceae bacterium]
MPQSAKLVLDSKTIELPTIEGTEDERAIDITSLRSQTGYITLDPALGNTGACKSAITYIDGEKGILRYRGYPIEQLAEKSGFIEVAWLLIFGELPTPTQRKRFSDRLSANAAIHEGFKHHFEGFPPAAPP